MSALRKSAGQNAGEPTDAVTASNAAAAAAVGKQCGRVKCPSFTPRHAERTLVRPEGTARPINARLHQSEREMETRSVKMRAQRACHLSSVKVPLRMQRAERHARAARARRARSSACAPARACGIKRARRKECAKCVAKHAARQQWIPARCRCVRQPSLRRVVCSSATSVHVGRWNFAACLMGSFGVTRF